MNHFTAVNATYPSKCLHALQRCGKYAGNPTAALWLKVQHINDAPTAVLQGA